MKKATFFLSFFLLCVAPWAKSQSVKGMITTQNSNKSPLAEVQILAKNGSSAISDPVGKFELPFTDKPQGEPVCLTFKKEGYYVAAPFQLVVANVSADASDFLPLVAVKKEYLAERSNSFYQLLQTNIVAKGKQIPAQTLQNQRYHAAEIATEIAVIDADFALAYVKNALEALTLAKIDEALQAIDETQLEAFTQKYLSQIAQNQRFVEMGNGKMVSKHEAKKQLITAYLLKARLLQAQGKFSEALRCLKANTTLDSSDFTATFALTQHQVLYEHTQLFADKLWKNAHNQADSLKIYVLLGEAETEKTRKIAAWTQAKTLLEKNQWQYVAEYPLVLLYLLQADRENAFATLAPLLESATQNNPTLYGTFLTEFQQIRGEEKYLVGDYKAAIADFEILTPYYAQNLAQMPALIQQKYATALVMSSIIYDKQNQLDALEKTLLNIKQVLSGAMLLGENAKTNQAYLAASLERLANLYLQSKKEQPAIAELKAAEGLYLALVQQVDTSYRLNLSHIETQLAGLYLAQKDLTNAEAYLQKVVKTQTSRSPKAVTLAQNLQLLGNFAENRKEWVNAASYYGRAQTIYTQHLGKSEQIGNQYIETTLAWAKALSQAGNRSKADSLYAFSATFDSQVPETQQLLQNTWRQLATQPRDTLQFEQSVKYWNLIQKQVQKYPTMANAQQTTSEVLYQLSELYRQQKLPTKADSCLAELIAFKQKGGTAQNSEDVFLLNAQLGLAASLMTQKKYDAVITYLQPLQNQLKTLSEKTPLVYKHKWITTITDLGTAWSKQGNVAKADSCLSFGEKLYFTLTPEDTSSQIAITRLWLSLAEVKIVQKKWDEAAKPLQNASNVLQNAVQNKPNRYEILWANVLKKRADLYLREKKEKEANAYYQKALALYDSFKDVNSAEQNYQHIELLLIGIDYYRDNKQKDKALAALSKAEELLKGCPNEETCKNNLVKVAELSKKLK